LRTAFKYTLNHFAGVLQSTKSDDTISSRNGSSDALTASWVTPPHSCYLERAPHGSFLLHARRWRRVAKAIGLCSF